MSETGRGGRRMFRARTLSPSAFRRKMRKRHVQSESDPESDVGSDQHDEAAAAAAAGGTEVHANSPQVYQEDEYEPVSADKYDALVVEYEKQREAFQQLEDEVAAKRTQLTQADEREREFAEYVREVEERDEKNKRRERQAEKALRERREVSDQSQMRDLNSRIEELEENLTTSRATIAKLREMHKEADDEVKRLQEVKTRQHRKIQQMEDQLTPASDSTDHIRRLGVEAQKQEKGREVLEDTNRELAERVAYLARQLEKTRVAFDEGDKQSREFQREVEELRREKKKLQNQLEEHRLASTAVPGSPVPGPAKAVHSLLDDLKGAAKRNRRTPVTSPNQRPRATPPLSQRVVGGKAGGVPAYDEAKERILAEELRLKPMFRLFFLTCLAVKSKMSYAFPELDVTSVDSRDLWREASDKGVAFELYQEWLERQLFERCQRVAGADNGAADGYSGGNGQQGHDMSATPNTVKRRFEARPRPPIAASAARVNRR